MVPNPPFSVVGNIQQCIDALAPYWTHKALEWYIRAGIIKRRPDGTVCCGLHPLARVLAYQMVLASANGEEALSGIRPSCHVYLWVAPVACSGCGREGCGGLVAMQRAVPWMQVWEPPEAGHSLHGTVEPEFIHRLREAVSAAAGGAPGPAR